MRLSRTLGLLLSAALTAATAQAGPRVEVRFAAGSLTPKKLADTAAVTSQLFARPEAPRIELVPPRLEGTLSVEGARWISEGSQREALLESLDAIWGRPVTVSEDGPKPETRAPVARQVLDSKLTAAALALVPAGLDLGLGGNQFYDRSKTGGGAGSAVVAGFQRATPVSLLPSQPVKPVKRAEPPSPAGPYEKQIQSAADRFGVPAETLRAVAQAKSGLAPGHVSGEAYGLMGLSKHSFAVLGGKGDILDPQANLDVGARILAGLLKQFDGDVPRALAAYQVGPRAVLHSGGIPQDSDVKDFLAAYERALRRGPSKPAVKANQPPTVARRVKDQLQESLIDKTAVGAARYRPMIRAMAKRSGVDADLMEAMVMRESEGDPFAESSEGALGLGQLMPKTAAQLGVTDPNDPAQNLRGMARHLSYLLDKFDDPVLAVAAYNAGERRVERAGNRIPRLRETKTYVRKVFDNYYALTGVRVDVEPYMPPPRQKKHAVPAEALAQR